MIWHIVRFDFTGVDAAVREDLEDRLEALGGLDEVAWLRLSRDLDDGQVTGLITGFATYEDLEAYRNHPDHVPVVAAIRESGVATARIDLETDDAVEDLP